MAWGIALRSSITTPCLRSPPPLSLANMNSIPLDWAARFSVGGVNMNFFIVKQLPVLPPEAYLEEARCGGSWVEVVVPRVLELTYTGRELRGFASDLGWLQQPFPWNATRRHRLQSELDAIFSHMYGLDRTDVEWILDAPAPSSSFPSLKQHELKRFGEYRTQRYVLGSVRSVVEGREPRQPCPLITRFLRSRDSCQDFGLTLLLCKAVGRPSGPSRQLSYATDENVTSGRR